MEWTNKKELKEYSGQMRKIPGRQETNKEHVKTGACLIFSYQQTL
jgi:hypothetical protein